MSRPANIYDICDDIVLSGDVTTEPGSHLRLLYRKTVGNFLLKTLVLRGCRHPAIPLDGMQPYRDMMRAAMRATCDDWKGPAWITKTFRPVAELLDGIQEPRWQLRSPVESVAKRPDRHRMEAAIRRILGEVTRVWDRDKRDPYFPVAAQIILSGDGHMTGASFMKVLLEVGSFEYQNAALLLSLVRCFIMATPKRLRRIRRPFGGVCEPLFSSRGWIVHRTAYYDAIFFEHLLARVNSAAGEAERLVRMMERLIWFIVLASREWLVSPRSGITHPAITCLPKGPGDAPLCRLSRSDWKTKRDLGFGDYVPDMDTTFLGLSVAKKWITVVEAKKLEVDRNLLVECERLLQHPYMEIAGEYQVGAGHAMDASIDYDGAVPIWFDKAFDKPGGRVVRRPLGNEICPGHNMNILESMLVNRHDWGAVTGRKLATLQRLVDFHHRLYASGEFSREGVFTYYLPEMYVYLTARMYDAYAALTDDERMTVDPGGKIAEMRRIAIAYCRDDLMGFTLNAFDAALAVTSLVLLRYESKTDGVLTRGIQVMCDAMGEGRRGQLFLAYEWSKMRHPTRIIVGSSIATSLFVMRALLSALDFFDDRAESNCGGRDFRPGEPGDRPAAAGCRESADTPPDHR